MQHASLTAEIAKDGFLLLSVLRSAPAYSMSPCRWLSRRRRATKKHGRHCLADELVLGFAWTDLPMRLIKGVNLVLVSFAACLNPRTVYTCDCRSVCQVAASGL